MFKDILKKRGVMKIWDNNTAWDKRREEIKDLLCREEYGYPPETAKNVSFELAEPEKYEDSFCAGNAKLLKLTCRGEVYGREFSFPFKAVIPKLGNNVPYFIHINFRPDIPDRYQPTEEIIDNGFAIISVCYNDITSDNEDFTNGVASAIFGGEERKPSDCGKIMIWAWAISLLRDYAETLPFLDHGKCAVIGHSRLGKTALIAGMMDERIKIAISNNSGCCGAAISREKIGESVDRICNFYPHWFCTNFYKYKRNEHEMPFDQHYLLASIAPRNVYVASAQEDLWADPESEYLGCIAASEVYEKLGLKGLVGEELTPVPTKVYQEGSIAYHIRPGVHYLSREDWLYYMEYIKNL